VYIADDQVGHFAASHFHAFLAVVGQERLIAEGTEQVHHQLHIRRVVFDNQDAC
jgi:hypothetical protein